MERKKKRKVLTMADKYSRREIKKAMKGKC